MQEATSEESIETYATEVLAGTGWQVDSVRQRLSRVEPSDRWWSTFEVSVSKDDEERKLRLVARGAFDEESWNELAHRLEQTGAGGSSDPINGLGTPTLFPEQQFAYWFYPYDPSMPGLPAAADASTMRRILLGAAEPPPNGAMPQLEIERVRYLPEVGAILRYTMNTSAGPLTVYGKVQPSHRGLRTHRIMDGLWRAAARYEDGMINLPHPLGYVEELGLLLEEAIPGKPVGGHRQSYEFQNSAWAAADAIAVVHESGVEADVEIRLDRELERLERVAEQFAYVHPQGHFMLCDLIAHLRKRMKASGAEECVPTHGDLKYDQFIQHNGRFTILDFDYFARAETSYDIGKYCAYVTPSMPRSWEESAAAEETRLAFIRRYREQRPHATLNRLQIYETVNLALRAMSFMWTQMHGWERMAETFLVLGHERLYTRLPE